MKKILTPIFLSAMLLLPSLSIGAPNPRGATLDISIHTSDKDKVADGQHQQGQSLNDLSVAKWALMQQGGNGAHAQDNCQEDDHWCCARVGVAECRPCCSSNYHCRLDPHDFPNFGLQGLCKPN